MRTIAAWIFLIALAGLLATGVMTMRPFGEPPADMDDYIIANAQVETGSNNVVTGVLFDYRGLDTLGEAVVLFTAVGGVLLILRGVDKKGSKI